MKLIAFTKSYLENINDVHLWIHVSHIHTHQEKLITRAPFHKESYDKS